jgi:ornithine carbamoyltransferase
VKKDLLSLQSLSREEIEEILMLAESILHQKHYHPLAGKTFALIFELPSARTRVSFEVGIYQLGGQSIYLSGNDLKMGEREAIKDVAKTLSRYVQGIIIRALNHRTIAELAAESSVPVINALSQFEHPCQVLADLYTITRKKRHLQGIKMAWVGDGNNVCRSFLAVAPKVGLNLHLAIPPEYRPELELLEKSQEEAAMKGTEVVLTDNPEKAVAGAEVVYTDTWISMGDEAETEKRRKIFKKYQVNQDLLNLAHPDCLVMHCLPAHRGEEITDEVLDGPNSVVFLQAENRLHLQKGVLVWLTRK